MSLRVELAERLKRLPPYLFAEFERKRAALEKQGKDIVNLGIGGPDQAPPRLLLDTMVAHLNDEYIHQYSSSQGIDEFKAAVASFMKKRYSVDLQAKEICMGIGSKELIAHMPLALTNPGDVVLCPEVVGEEWQWPLVHGLLHLLGHEHGPDMEARERAHLR